VFEDACRATNITRGSEEAERVALKIMLVFQSGVDVPVVHVRGRSSRKHHEAAARVERGQKPKGTGGSRGAAYLIGRSEICIKHPGLPCCGATCDGLAHRSTAPPTHAHYPEAAVWQTSPIMIAKAFWASDSRGKGSTTCLNIPDNNFGTFSGMPNCTVDDTERTQRARGSVAQ
jgi:hypothetical protein